MGKRGGGEHRKQKLNTWVEKATNQYDRAAEEHRIWKLFKGCLGGTLRMLRDFRK